MKQSTILIVEDSQIQAEILRRLLVNAGYSCITAADGEAGLMAVRVKRPDLVVSDIQMPVLDGYQMCEKIKHDPIHKYVPVILLTALSDPVDVIRGLNSGAEAYLTKPYDHTSLLTQVRRLLSTEKWQINDLENDEPLDVEINNSTYQVSTGREKILQMLISTYDNAVQQNRLLLKLEADLSVLNRELEFKVTERTLELAQEEKRAREAESRYRTLFSLLPEGVSLLIPDAWRFSEFNDVACGQLGYLRDEFDSLSIIDVCVPEEKNTLIDYLNQAINYKEFSFTSNLLTREGKVIEVYIRSRLINLDGKKMLNCILRDVSDINRARKIERELEHKATHDLLTDLPGKNLLLEAITQSIHSALKENSSLTLIAIELSRLNAMAVGLGHEATDMMQIELAERLRTLQPKAQMVARINNENFIYLVDGLSDASTVPELLTRIFKITNIPFEWEGSQFEFEPYIGISSYPKDAQNSDALLQSAEAALYKAKLSGRKGVVLASPELNQQVQNLIKKESALRAAVSDHEFEMYFQPRVNLISGKVAGAEALIRWKSKEQEYILPKDFIPLAEEIGLIIPITEWVVNEVCRQQKKWLDSDIQIVPISINLVADHFRDEKIISVIKDALEVNQLPAKYLEVEITESAAMENAERTIEILKIIRELGLLVAIDDFGTGYSSLSYLEKFPVDILKIDISFIQGILTNPHAAVITSVIIAMAKELNYSLVAEGVELEGQRQFLEKHNCEEGQGYLFSKPITAIDFSNILKNDTTF